MLALCLTLSMTYYAKSYAGIIGWSLITRSIASGSGDLDSLGHIWVMFLHGYMEVYRSSNHHDDHICNIL